MSSGTSVGSIHGADDARSARVVDQAVRLVKGRRRDLPKGIAGDSAAAFIADYYRYISPEELASRTAEDLTASALDHLAFGATLSRGVTLVRATAGARRRTV